MPKALTPDDRRRIAATVKVNPATLYQAMTGRGAGFSAQECVRIERESGKELRRWDLRPSDWHLIWPELKQDPEAPEIESTAG